MGDTGNNPPAEEELTPEESAKFGRFLERHEQERARLAERRKEPKDWGEAMDRISDDVCDKLAKRFGLVDVGELEPEVDDAPSAGGGGKVLGWLTGEGRKAAGS